jgi:hypothetical protein
MALLAADFVLTEAELAKLNEYLISRLNAYATEGEDPPCSLRVCFSFLAGQGCEVEAFLDGDLEGAALRDRRPPGLGPPDRRP